MSAPRTRGSKAHPQSLVDFIMAAIDEVAPGRGREIYWNGWCRFSEALEREQRKRAEQQLAHIAPPPEEEWTLDV